MCGTTLADSAVTPGAREGRKAHCSSALRFVKAQTSYGLRTGVLVLLGKGTGCARAGVSVWTSRSSCAPCLPKG